MEIKTKFNIGDYAWCMKNNMPIKVRITSIEAFYGSSQGRIKYNAEDALNPITWLDHPNLFENTLFYTKTDLLNSL